MNPALALTFPTSACIVYLVFLPLSTFFCQILSFYLGRLLFAFILEETGQQTENVPRQILLIICRGTTQDKY